MGSGEKLTIALTGGGPWGFRLQGGGDNPLQVSKIRKRSKAHANDLREGDTLHSVNGVSVMGRSHESAMDLVDAAGHSLVLEITRTGYLRPVVALHTASAAETVSRPAELHEVGTTSSTKVTVSEGDSWRTVKTESVRQAVEEATDVQRSVRHRQVTTIRRADVQPPKMAVELKQQAAEKPFQCTPTPFKPYREEVKENIAPEANLPTGQPPPSPAPKQVPVFQVKDVTSGKTQSIRQPPGGGHQTSNVTARPFSLVDMQKNKFGGKPVPPPTPPKPKPPAVAPKPQKTALAPLQPTVNEFNDDRVDYHEHPIFGPPVEISLHDFDHAQIKRTHIIGLMRADSLDSDGETSGTSSITKRSRTSREKVYSDSAFYNDPSEVYPTIEEQMQLCKIIAKSLTSAANKKARGAKMFAKRQRRSARWIHDGLLSGISSDAGDVADLDDLDSELSPTEGGSKPLFQFRIPNLKRQTSETNAAPKMSLTPEQFERLRVGQKRCDHRGVSPNTCFSLVEDLQSSKGRGAKLFDKRRAKSEKWVVDESNVKKTPPSDSQQTKLVAMLSSQARSTKSPWEAALENPSGSVDDAFRHLSERERLQKLSQVLAYPPPVEQVPPLPSPQPVNRQADLTAESSPGVLEGPTFNRTAKGWQPRADERHLKQLLPEVRQSPPEAKSPPPTAPKPTVFKNYNPKLQAWNQQSLSKGGARSPDVKFKPIQFQSAMAGQPPTCFPGPPQPASGPEVMPGSDL